MARSAAQSRPARLYLASFEGRVAAALIDVVVLLIIASLLVTIGALAILISSDFERVDASENAIYTFWVAVASIPFWQLAYFFVCWAWKGQTVGGLVMQIAVVRSDGRRLGILGSVARIIGILSYAVIVGFAAVAAFALQDNTWLTVSVIATAAVLVLLGLAWSILDRYRRTLHDRLAGTIVVRTV